MPSCMKCGCWYSEEDNHCSCGRATAYITVGELKKLRAKLSATLARAEQAERERDAAREDTAQLNWLETCNLEVRDSEWLLCFYRSAGPRPGQMSLREYIAAARRAER